MSDGVTVQFQVHFGRGQKGQRKLRPGVAKIPVGPGRIPRVARLMALAIRFNELIAAGEVRDYADLARLGHVSRARVTQIMNLLNLAPDIQEAILFLPETPQGTDPITERHLRPIAAEADWGQQRAMWGELSAVGCPDSA